MLVYRISLELISHVHDDTRPFTNFTLEVDNKVLAGNDDKVQVPRDGHANREILVYVCSS